ncbi:MAG: response regulator [Chloroflexota bacterium]
MEGRYLLLVEDNPDDVNLTLRVFERSGIANKVQVAADGVDALESLQGTGRFAGRDPDDLPALILLDLKMPRMNGIELLREMRADTKNMLVPVVILTTSNEDRDMVDSYRLGANSYVRKPVTFNHFIEAVQQLGVNWLVLNSVPEDKS